MQYIRPQAAITNVIENEGSVSLFQGNCEALLPKIPDESISLTFSSPPYCMGKSYEPGNTIEDFIAAHKRVLPEIVRITKPGGSICWQVGYHVKDNTVIPLDFIVYDILRSVAPEIALRNRVAWTFGHGFHASKRFSGRHEVVLWFTKGEYEFDLNAIRVPQKYPGKKSSRGPNRGKFSGNPQGKNPSDVWDIPNVKANHIEKTDHPCQFPVALPQRFVKSVTQPGDVVFDPYAGVCSAGVAAVIEGRKFLGAELSKEFCQVGLKRLKDAGSGQLKVRPLNQSIYVPSETDAVAVRPDHFARAAA